MLVSHTHRFIFTKTIKTAGTSLELALQPYCLPKGWPIVGELTNALETDAGIVGARGAPAETASQKWRNHMSASELRTRVGDRLWRDYFKFTVVRNPFDKVVSYFHFTNSDLSGNRDEALARFADWMQTDAYRAAIDRHTYLIDGKVAMDMIYRFEELSEAIADINARLGVSLTSLPRLKAGYRPAGGAGYRDYYDDDSRRRVARAFAFELRAFDYEF